MRVARDGVPVLKGVYASRATPVHQRRKALFEDPSWLVIDVFQLSVEGIGYASYSFIECSFSIVG